MSVSEKAPKEKKAPKKKKAANPWSDDEDDKPKKAAKKRPKKFDSDSDISDLSEDEFVAKKPKTKVRPL